MADAAKPWTEMTRAQMGEAAGRMVAENLRLRDALARYGEHDGDCAASVCGAPGDARCTCGYDDAVANASPPLRPMAEDTTETRGVKDR